MRGAAFFDLDGTLLTVNSATLWFRRERRLGRVGFLLQARIAGMLLAYRFGVLDPVRFLRAGLGTVRGLAEETVRAETRAWWAEEVRRFRAPGADAVLARHRAEGEPLVLLTSGSRYAGELARDEWRLDDALCQGYEVRDGRFTGEPELPICYGPGKVTVAEAWAARHGVDLARSSFYSDSTTDTPMLERVGRPYAVNPDPRLRLLAKARGWPILDWGAAGGGG